MAFIDDKDLEEEIVDEKLVWEGAFLSAYNVGVRLPNGKEAQRDVVRHPGAVAIVALTDDGRIVLVRQYRTALERVCLEIPAGKIDKGEDPERCAVRELEEETGVRAHKIRYLTALATSAGFCDEIIHLYMATDLEFMQAHPDEDEFVRVELMELQELINMVLDGQIEDAKTMIGALICDAISHRLEA